jgi:hypothetical protein
LDDPSATTSSRFASSASAPSELDVDAPAPSRCSALVADDSEAVASSPRELVVDDAFDVDESSFTDDIDGVNCVDASSFDRAPSSALPPSPLAKDPETLKPPRRLRSLGARRTRHRTPSRRTPHANKLRRVVAAYLGSGAALADASVDDNMTALEAHPRACASASARGRRPRRRRRARRTRRASTSPAASAETFERPCRRAPRACDSGVERLNPHIVAFDAEPSTTRVRYCEATLWTAERDVDRVRRRSRSSCVPKTTRSSRMSTRGEQLRW